MHILERVRRCKYCRRDVTDTITARAYAENPLCQACLPERINKAAHSSGPKKRVHIGTYVFARPVSQKLA